MFIAEMTNEHLRLLHRCQQMQTYCYRQVWMWNNHLYVDLNNALGMKTDWKAVESKEAHTGYSYWSLRNIPNTSRPLSPDHSFRFAQQRNGKSCFQQLLISLHFFWNTSSSTECFCMKSFITRGMILVTEYHQVWL